jgi:hypothetical protein
LNWILNKFKRKFTVNQGRTIPSPELAGQDQGSQIKSQVVPQIVKRNNQILVLSRNEKLNKIDNL